MKLSFKRQSFEITESPIENPLQNLEKPHSMHNTVKLLSPLVSQKQQSTYPTVNEASLLPRGHFQAHISEHSSLLSQNFTQSSTEMQLLKFCLLFLTVTEALTLGTLKIKRTSRFSKLRYTERTRLLRLLRNKSYSSSYNLFW